MAPSSGTIAKVQIYAGGSLLCTATSAPYSCVWQVPAAPNKSYTIQAKAYDTANNVGTGSISVTVK